MRIFWTIALLCCFASMAHGSDDLVTEEDRAPVPEEADLAEVKKLVKEVYKDQYNRRGPEERRAFAESLLDDAKGQISDPNSRYVMLCEARDLAIQVAMVETAMEAAKEIARTFKVDPEETYLAAISDLRATVRTTNAFEAASDAAIELVDQAIQSGNLDVATKAADFAETYATGAKDMQRIAVARSRRATVKDQSTAYLEMKIAQDKLRSSPDDPQSKYTVGSYMCLYLNDWDQGLALVAEGSDEAWAQAAKADLANPVDLNEMVKVADNWWELGQKKPSQKRQFMKRSEFWYELAVSAADGLLAAKIAKRLEQIQSEKTGAGIETVSEATRRVLPTTTELTRLKELCRRHASQNTSSNDIVRMVQSINERLSNDLMECSVGDFAARIKADSRVRKIISAYRNPHSGNYYYTTPLWEYCDEYVGSAPSKDEFVQRLILFLKLNSEEKMMSEQSSSNSVQNAILRFTQNNYAMFQTSRSRADFCMWLKTKGVRSDGIDKYLQRYSGM